MDDRPIGVFDSGIGGISALRNMARLLPGEHFIYYGDDRNAPYGTKSREEILRLALADADELLRRNVKAIVIACNTATSAAAGELRASLGIPVIGMEPALKPASRLRKNGAVAVLATPATLKLEKFERLMQAYGENAIPVPCPELVGFVERGELEGSALDACLRRALAPCAGIAVDCAVLGCTHFVFLSGAIRRALPGARLVDGNEGTARQLARVLAREGALREGDEGRVEMHTSGDDEKLLPLMGMLFRQKIDETDENR